MADKDRLPKSLVPIAYHLSLHDFRLAPEWTYKGLVQTSCQVRDPVKEIHINAKYLDIESFHVEANGGVELAKATNISYDQISERAIITLSSVIPLEVAEVCLHIAFTAHIGDTLAGCYRSYAGTDDVAGNDDQWMISTQFQACEARRAFPCFDEPNLKATFVLEIVARSDLVVLSNTPQRQSLKEPGKDGLTRVTFEETPKMSTYLLAWALGDFDYVEAFLHRGYENKHLPVRVYATRGLQAQCTFALEHAVKALELLTDRLGVSYPLAKCDLLVVHGLSHGAMENWGLVTFRPTTLLCDYNYSDSKTRQQIAYIIAHELSHQWFGNLVTMNWWDDLWLNEGFATYIGWWIVDRMHPEWRVWVNYLVEDFQQGLQLDSLQSSHPIQVSVGNANEVVQIFDHISYLKGSAIIRMLGDYLGNEAFFRGVSQYLQIHQYGNATTYDLWRALGAASAKDVEGLMSPWVQCIGYPLLSLEDDGCDYHIRQTRYTMVPRDEDTAVPNGTNDSKDQLWSVPLTFEGDNGHPESMLLMSRAERVGLPKSKLPKIDPGHHGFYRTLYSPETLQELFRSDWIAIEDRIGLLGDSISFVLSGHMRTPALLRLLLQLQDESSSSVWALIGKAIQKVQITFGHNERVKRGLRKFVLQLIGPAMIKLGHQSNELSSTETSYWNMKGDETHEAVSLRRQLLELAVVGAHETNVIAEGKAIWAQWQASESRDSIHADLLGLLLQLAVQECGVEAYETIKRDFLATADNAGASGHRNGKATGNTANVNTRESYLTSIAHTGDHTLVRDVLEFAAHSGKLTMSETYPFASAISENIAAQDVVWQFIRDAWDDGGIKRLREIGRGKGIDHWMKRSLANVSDHSIQQDMAAFFADKDTNGFDRGLKQVLEQIDINAQYRLRDEQILEDWLKTQGYLD